MATLVGAPRAVGPGLDLEYPHRTPARWSKHRLQPVKIDQGARLDTEALKNRRVGPSVLFPVNRIDRA